MNNRISKIVLALLILGGGFFASCATDDVVVPSPVMMEEKLAGVWNLVHIQGGLKGVQIDYAVGEVTWFFNDDSNTLLVENTIMTTGPENVYSGLDSGTYTFEVRQDKDMQILYVNDAKQGEFSITDDILKIDEGLASDGLIYEFNR